MELWNRAIEQIEQRVADGASGSGDGVVDVGSLARTTLTSEHHFRRLFTVLAGMPVSEYIRRRRLTVAAADVVAGREALQDIAIRFGYDSADAFSRAFRAVHGLSPSQARASGADLRSQAPLRITLRVEGAEPMTYRLVEQEAFTLVGRRRRMAIVARGTNPEIEQFREELGLDVLRDISARSTRQPARLLSVSTDFVEGREDGASFEFWFAAAVDGAPEEVDAGQHETRTVPAATWLVLSSSGPSVEEVQQLWPQAYGEWFAANPYEPVDGPELVAPVLDDAGGAERYELWLRVEPTSS